MSDIPFEDTFEEYITFHKNVVEDAKQISKEILGESSNTSMSDDEFMETHNLIDFDIFLKSMNKRYGI